MEYRSDSGDFLQKLGVNTTNPLYLIDRSPAEKDANAAQLREQTLACKVKRWIQGGCAGFLIGGLVVGIIVYVIIR